MENVVEGAKKQNVVVRMINQIGHTVLGGILDLGEMTDFVFSSLVWISRPPFRLKEIITQIEFVGNKSVFIIFLSSLFTGMVFALQTYSGFHMVNSDTLIGPTVAL